MLFTDSYNYAVLIAGIKQEIFIREKSIGLYPVQLLINSYLL